MGCLPFFGLGRPGAVGLDPLQQCGGGFVLGVLGDELAGEGFFQDGLAQGVGAGEGGVDLGLERVGGVESGVEEGGRFRLVRRGNSRELARPSIPSC
jgi:hypothetical protein